MTHTTRALPTGADDLLGAEEERALQRRIEAGVVADAALRGWLETPPRAVRAELAAIVADGQRARQALVDANAGLVWWIVAPIARMTGLGRAELFQEGMVGLLEAVQRFDSRRGRLSTYAVPRIKMRAWDAAVTALGSVGLSARKARQWRRAQAIVAELAPVLGRTPRAEEVARVMGQSPAVVRELLVYVPPASVAPDAPVWDDVWCSGAPQDDRDIDRLAVRRLLRRLDAFDRAVVTHLFGLDGPPRTHGEVARALGRSESTIRRRERRALELLRAGGVSGLAA